jgi:(p)ppGpp synthase/HD superfamily hydrolase
MKNEKSQIPSEPKYIKFASDAHGDQKYGEHDYVHHLFCVAQILKEFGYTDEKWQAAAWLHDVIEDTDATFATIWEQFGDDVSRIVYCCTGFGKNRAARLENILSKIAVYPDAAVVKLADRIANVEAGGKIDMYKKEQITFEAGIKEFVPEAMWLRLEKALDIVKV